MRIPLLHSRLALETSCHNLLQRFHSRKHLDLCQSRLSSTDAGGSKQLPIIHIPRCNIYRFGHGHRASPVFKELDWTVNEGESWAVVGSGAGEKTTLLETLRGHLRISPPPSNGLFPAFSARGLDPYSCVSLVSFAHRSRGLGSEFYDYTARYGAIRDEDRLTLRQSLLQGHSGSTPLGEDEQTRLREALGLNPLFDLPFVALSNGQTRKARIYKALLERPEILLLDEPLTGVDAHTRTTLLSLLHSLHARRQPRIILSLRSQDPIPEWITHVAVVDPAYPGRVVAGSKQDMSEALSALEISSSQPSPDNIIQSSEANRDVLVEMTNVNVSYSGRHVLKDINWAIRAGERWHLQGANGSGKTTLLSLLTGDHPQSYMQRAPINSAASFSLFGAPRHTQPTAALRSMLGVVSPELANAFPRRPGVTVWEVVATGFEGAFVNTGRRGVGTVAKWPSEDKDGVISAEEEAWREARVWEVLQHLGPTAWTEPTPAGDQESDVKKKDFAAREFVGLSPGEQSVVLLARALVGRAPLVLLDEVWSGMDSNMVEAARRYLRGDGVGPSQAVVVISHWEDEVPWSVGGGLRRLRLDGGEATELRNDL